MSEDKPKQEIAGMAELIGKSQKEMPSEEAQALGFEKTELGKD